MTTTTIDDYSKGTCTPGRYPGGGLWSHREWAAYRRRVEALAARDAESARTGERWRWIEGYEGVYEISDNGRVWTFGRHRARCEPLTPIPNGSHDAPSVSLAYPPGEGPIGKTGRRMKYDRRQIGRLVLETFVGPSPSEGHLCHFRDGDRSNAALDNLEWRPIDYAASAHRAWATRRAKAARGRVAA